MDNLPGMWEEADLVGGETDREYTRLKLSQNDWPVYESAPPVAIMVPGVLSLRVAPGDVAYLFSELATDFHTQIESLSGSIRDDWGWAYRPIRGQTNGYSNHSSGTAIDLNALQHGRGVHNTFSTGQKQVMNRLLDVKYRDVIRWGENYRTTIDGMHFEINADKHDVHLVAQAIRDMKENDMPTAAEIATAVLNTPIRLMEYVDGVYQDSDDMMTLAETTQHAAGQSRAAMRNTEAILELLRKQ